MFTGAQGVLFAYTLGRGKEYRAIYKADKRLTHKKDGTCTDRKRMKTRGAGTVVRT